MERVVLECPGAPRSLEDELRDIEDETGIKLRMYRGRRCHDLEITIPFYMINNVDINYDGPYEIWMNGTQDRRIIVRRIDGGYFTGAMVRHMIHIL